MIRKSSLPPDGKRAIVNRLKSARGHLDAVIKQISAVRGALDRVSRIELENHLEHCLVERIHAGGSAAAIAEVVEILGLRTEVA